MAQAMNKVLVYTHRLLSSSFLGLPYRILNMNHKKELLRSLWVVSIGSWVCAEQQIQLQCRG